MKSIILAVAALFMLAFSAQAGQCPSLMQEVDSQLQSADLSDDERARVMELRAQGEAQHEAGQHAESVQSLQQALEILGQ